MRCTIKTLFLLKEIRFNERQAGQQQMVRLIESTKIDWAFERLQIKCQWLSIRSGGRLLTTWNTAEALPLLPSPSMFRSHYYRKRWSLSICWCQKCCTGPDVKSCHMGNCGLMNKKCAYDEPWSYFQPNSQLVRNMRFTITERTHTAYTTRELKFPSFTYYPKCILNHTKIKKIRIIKNAKIWVLLGATTSVPSFCFKEKR